jgi:serine protease Do
MKPISKSLAGFMAATTGAAALVIFLSLFNLWARDTGPSFKVDTKPIVRSARAGNSYALVIKKVAPSVVNIYSTVNVPISPFFRRFYGNPYGNGNRPFTRTETSLGSGVIVSPNGYILTANHVVDGADKIKVAMGNDAGKQFTATVVGADPATDVAVVKIDTNHLPAITLGDSDQVEVGDVVLAVGNPFGVGQSVTMGIVSALGRRSPEARGYVIQDFIQTDAAINPGNSGGALVDTEGRLIGINTMIESSSDGNEGVGFAVPVNLARNVMEHLVTSGKVTRGYLGIRMQDVDADLAQQFNLSAQTGVLVNDVITNGPAGNAGIKSGDVILAFNGKKVPDMRALQLAISECSPGSVATVSLVRKGAQKTFTVKLVALPAELTQSGNAPNASAPSGTNALDGARMDDLSPDLRQQLRIPANIKGAVVTDVQDDSNAANAGLQKNDVIQEINHQTVAGADDAARLCKQAQGGRILVKVWRRDGDNTGAIFLSVDTSK